MAELAGGRELLLQSAQIALEKGQLQWALELVTHSQVLEPRCLLSRRLRISILRPLAASQTAATGRNWYLTSVKEAEDEIDFRRRRSGAYHKTSLKAPIQTWTFLSTNPAQNNLGGDGRSSRLYDQLVADQVDSSKSLWRSASDRISDVGEYFSAQKIAGSEDGRITITDQLKLSPSHRLQVRDVKVLSVRSWFNCSLSTSTVRIHINSVSHVWFEWPTLELGHTQSQNCSWNI